MRRITGDTTAPRIGRSLDHYIETQVHGLLRLDADVDALALDASYEGTALHDKATALGARYDIAVTFIPQRAIHPADIGDAFRGPAIRPLAGRIVTQWPAAGGLVTAYTLGLAAQDAVLHPDRWQDFGDAPMVYQYIKQLWHTMVWFGSPEI